MARLKFFELVWENIALLIKKIILGYLLIAAQTTNA